jgi:uncharacterized protein YcbX
VHVAALWRHPVKSALGEPLQRAVVTAAGVVGDRAWAVRDVASGAVLSAKREPRLLQLSARILGEAVHVDVPGVGRSAGHNADALLTEWLGRPVRLDVATGSAYVDEADLHLVTRAELGAWDERRFRPNVVIDGIDALDALVGERLRVGGIDIEITKRTKRCAMPTMAQPGLEKDVDVLRSLARGRDLRLGVYARVITRGNISVGDSAAAR